MRSRHIVIVGSGVVGTATGEGLASKGHRVVFCDVALDRVFLLKKRGYTAIDSMELEAACPDAYLISVPSPTGPDGRVDRSFVADAADAVARSLRNHSGWPVVVVRSTVPPGTTADLVIPALERSGRTVGRDFGVCMNPEFLRARSAGEDFLHPRVIVIGAFDQRSLNALLDVYAPWEDVPVVATTLRTAEATKYVANLFNATKISFFNEMHRILSAADADPDVAAQAAALGAEGLWNPSYGTRGGSPYGGACLPKDTRGFLGYAADLGMDGIMPILQAVVGLNGELTREAGPAPLSGSTHAGEAKEAVL